MRHGLTLLNTYQIKSIFISVTLIFMVTMQCKKQKTLILIYFNVTVIFNSEQYYFRIKVHAMTADVMFAR
jgi:hypothetical protein